MYGQGHRWCPNCNNAIRGNRSCGGCGLAFAELMLFDSAWDNGYVDQGLFNSGGIGFDPMDGQFTVQMGDGLSFEPGTGQVDGDTPFGDFPV
jgi:hypothetical protein